MAPTLPGRITPCFVGEDPLAVVENIFTFDGEQGHEVVFVYAGRLAEGDVVPPDGGWYDDMGLPMWVEWRPIGAPVAGDEDTLPLYPDGLGSLSAFR